MQLHAEVGLLRRALHLALPHALAAAASPPLAGGLPEHAPSGLPPEALAQALGAQLQAGHAAGAALAGPGEGTAYRVPDAQTPSSSPGLAVACAAAAAQAAPAQQQLLGSVLGLPYALQPSGSGPSPDPGFSCPLRLHATQGPQDAELTAGQGISMQSGGAVHAAPLALGSPGGGVLAGADTPSGVPEVGALASLPGGLPSLAEVLGAAQRLSRAHALPAALPPGVPPLHEPSVELAALPPWPSILRMPGDQAMAAPLGELSAPPPAALPTVRELLAAVDEAAQAADSQDSSDVRQSPSAQQPALLLPSPGTSPAGLSSAYEALVMTPPTGGRARCRVCKPPRATVPWHGGRLRARKHVGPGCTGLPCGVSGRGGDRVAGAAGRRGFCKRTRCSARRRECMRHRQRGSISMALCLAATGGATLEA